MKKNSMSLTNRDWSRPFGDVFDQFFTSDMMPSPMKNREVDFNFSPSCEVKEDEKNYYFRVDIPGVKKEDISVDYENQTLTIQAERHEEKEDKSEKQFFSEIYYGSYSRSFHLDKAIDENKIDAKYKDGVLSLEITKIEKEKERRKIQIN